MVSLLKKYTPHVQLEVFLPGCSSSFSAVKDEWWFLFLILEFVAVQFEADSLLFFLFPGMNLLFSQIR